MSRKSSSYFGGFFGSRKQSGGSITSSRDDEPDHTADEHHYDDISAGGRDSRRISTNTTGAVAEPQQPQTARSGEESDADDVTRTDDGAPKGSRKSRKIKFKRAKKIAKKASMAYMATASATGHSRFHGWSKAEMAELLVSHGIELRNESTIESCTLKDLCEALYAGSDVPEKPPMPNLIELVFMNIHARRIQNVWIIHQMGLRLDREAEANDHYVRRMSAISSVHNMETDQVSQAELMYMENPHMQIVGDGRMVDGSGAVHVLEALDSDEEEPEAGVGEGGGASMAAEGKTAEDGADASAGAAGAAMSPVKKAKKKRGVNILDIPWEKPVTEKAELYADYVQPRKGGKGGSKFDLARTTTGRHCFLGGLGEQFDLWEEGQISEFGIYGSGVTNYFKFIKWCFWLFMTLAMLSLPMLVLNIQGPNVSNDGLQALARTTAGNLEDTFAGDAFSLKIPGCTGYGVYDIDCSLNRLQISRFYAYLDVVIVLTAFCGFLWLRHFEKVEEAVLDKNTVNASMFTVMVSNLPADVTEDQLIEHFGKVCHGHKIAAVSLAYDNIDEMNECYRRGNLIRSKVRAVHEHRHRCTTWREQLDEDDANKRIEEERTAFLKRQTKLSDQLKVKEQLLEELAEKPTKVIYAFITFDRVAGKEEAVDVYNGHSFMWYWFFGQHLKLAGKMLRVQYANEPSTIIWHNLPFTRWDRFKRRSLTTFLALLLIVISLFTIFSADYLEEVRSPVADDDEERLCPEGFENLSDKEQVEYVEDNEDQIYCYCDQFATLDQARKGTCRSYFYDRMEAQVLAFFASMIVLIVNFLLERAVRYSSSFEKHHTEDGRGTSMFIRVFVLKYINTSLVFFVNNNPTILRAIFGLDTNSKAEFTADWFSTVGVTIILVQIGDVVAGHGDKVMKWLKHRAYLFGAKNPKLAIALTQDELNRAFVGPEFEFAFNYAQLLATLFVCFTFSSGIPVLYMIGAGNFFVTYFVEKYLFTRLYCIPPHFSNNVGKRATALIPYALVLHCAIAIWMFTNPDLFENSEQDTNTGGVGGDVVGHDIERKVTGATALPLFILMLLILILRILTHFFKATTRKFIECFYVTFGRCYRHDSNAGKSIASAQAVVTYTRAVQRNLIKGLATYNILQNPIYKEKFAITWKFATANKNVRDVRLLKAKAHMSDTETDAAKVDEMQRKIHAPGAKERPHRIVKNRSFASSFYMPINGVKSALEDDDDENENGNKNKGARSPKATKATTPKRSDANDGATSATGNGAIDVDEAPRCSSPRHASPRRHDVHEAPRPQSIDDRGDGPSFTGSESQTPRSAGPDITDILAPTCGTGTTGGVDDMYMGPPVVATPAPDPASRGSGGNRTPRRVHVHRDGTVTVSNRDGNLSGSDKRHKRNSRRGGGRGGGGGEMEMSHVPPGSISRSPSGDNYSAGRGSGGGGGRRRENRAQSSPYPEDRGNRRRQHSPRAHPPHQPGPPPYQAAPGRGAPLPPIYTSGGRPTSGPPHSPFAAPNGTHGDVPYFPPPGPMYDPGPQGPHGPHGGRGQPMARPYVPRIGPDGFEVADHLLYENDHH